MQTGSRGLELSPFQLKDELIRFAKEKAQSKAAAHPFLNAGRGNPNRVATTPRAAFFRLGEFALAEWKRVWDEPDLGGMPRRAGIADRFRAFLAGAGGGPGVNLLRGGLEYGTRMLGFDADAFVHELVHAAIGDDYPDPDHPVVHRYLEKIAQLPAAERVELRARRGALTTDPDLLRLVDRLVADSRAVALNHTPGSSPPQQAQVTLPRGRG